MWARCSLGNSGRERYCSTAFFAATSYRYTEPGSTSLETETSIFVKSRVVLLTPISPSGRAFFRLAQKSSMAAFFGYTRTRSPT